MFGEIKLGFAIASVYYIKTEMDNESRVLTYGSRVAEYFEFEYCI